MSDDNPYAPSKTQEEEMLDDLRRVGELHEEKLSLDEYAEHGEHSKNKIYRHFESFTRAVRKAGLFPVGNVNQQDLLRAIKKLGDDLGRPPTPEEMDQKGLYSLSLINEEFGGYRTALSEARYDDDEIDGCWNSGEKASVQDAAVPAGDDQESSEDDRQEVRDDSVIDNIMSDFDQI